MPTLAPAAPITGLEVAAYQVPTNRPEADGTLEWTHTILVVVAVRAGASTGLGFTYADTATAMLVRDVLSGVVVGRDAVNVPGCWSAMVRAIRNLGRPGVASMAIAAVDTALWDLKAKLFDVPLVDLIGRVRDEVDVYGSGGFTTDSVDEIERQFGEWAAAGIRRMKMKVGRDTTADRRRVEAARAAIGPDVELFVDANGAWRRAEALGQAEAFARCRVTWFEEPVSSDDLEGLRFLCDRAPAGMAITAGEYGYDVHYFRRMIQAGAVHVLQADATRCAGLSGFLQVGALCDAWSLPLSAHTAPSLHAHVGCALPSVVHVEYFHDHARIERMLFDGALHPAGGVLRPDRSRPGLGLEFKRADAARFEL